MNTSLKTFKRIFTFAQLIFIAFAAASAIKAQTSSVDLSFNAVPDKNAASAAKFLLQPDNKIIAYGDFQAINGSAKNRIARFNAGGDLDATFNCTVCDFRITNAALQPDGKIIVSGYALTPGPNPVIYRLNQDGSRDASFVSSLACTYSRCYESSIQVQAILPDGKILVTFYYGVSGGATSSVYELYRLNPDGTVDSSFNKITLYSYLSNSFLTRFVKVTVAPDGKIFVNNNNLYYDQRGMLRRYNADGTPDTTFEPLNITYNGSSSQSRINDFDIQADGSVIIVGKFTAVNGASRQNAAKILSAGNVDLSFNSSISDEATGVKILPDGKVLISTSSRLYRLNADGSPDNSFNSPANLTLINSFMLDSAGRIVLYGSFTENGGSVSKFARLNQDGSIESSFTATFGIASSVTAIAAQTDGRVIFAGDFARVNGVPRVSIVRVNADGSLDATFNSGTGFNGTVSEIVVQPDGKILVAGNFDNYNGVSRRSLARLNADGSLDITFNPVLTSASQSNNSVLTIALQTDGKILIGGDFMNVNGQARTSIARLNADGSLDASFNPMFSGAPILDIFAQADGKILVGGRFTGVNGFNRANLVRLNPDGSLDNSFNAGDIYTVKQIEAQPDGRYLVLTISSGSNFNTIVRLNNNGERDTTFIAPTLSPNDSNASISQFLLQPDGTILVGGSFSQIGNASRANFARFRPNGTLDNGFFPSGANAAVRTIVRQADGRILVGGDFSVIGGVARLSIARLNVSPYHLLTPFDFDGDGRADVAVFRPSNGYWYQLRSQNNSFYGLQFGASSDRIAPADYDGDGRTDIAVFRGTVAGAGNFAYFYITNSSDNSFRAVQFGATGDVPVSGDWDGDGKADLAVYRDGSLSGGQSYFFYRPSSAPGVDFRAIAWGATGDKPVMGDFDGDGKLDAAVFRPSNAIWYILKSSNNQVIQVQFGLGTDIPVPADYDGDGVTNIAVFRPSNGYWYTSTNPQTNYGAVQFGVNGDLPVPADYDGDGKADVAAFRPSNGGWYLNRTTSGFTGVQFGTSEDKPIPNAYIR